MPELHPTSGASGTLDVRQIERPVPALLAYYAIVSLVVGPLFPVFFLPRLFRYMTLRYRLDEEGISVRWGVLFRREIQLTYSRIQDIHLSSNVVERWLSLARIEIQTASGSAKAELTIEGVREFEEVRDYIYARMRGLTDAHDSATVPRGRGARLDGAEGAALAATLRDVARELRGVREALERRDVPPPTGP